MTPEHAKTDAEYFRDWELATFGHGSGTGEEYVIPVLRRFLELCDQGDFKHAYDHQILEAELTPAVAWLLINALSHANVIECGTSPRFGWLTPTGNALKAFMLKYTPGELIYMLLSDDDYKGCGLTFCNCGPHSVMGPVCPNPFWSRNR